MTARLAGLVLLMSASLAADSGGGLRWPPPPNWKSEGQRPMRLATYQVPPAAADQESGECGVYYFGEGQGGSAEANIDAGSANSSSPAASPPKMQLRWRSEP